MVKKTRDPEKTRAHIIEVAFGEVYRKGFQGVSIRDIVAKTDLTTGAFFHYFATKNDLGYALVDEVIKKVTLETWIFPLAAYKNPIQGIISRYRKFIETVSDDFLTYGCAINNLTQEMSAVDAEFGEKLHSVMRLWIEGLEGYLEKAQNDGYLKKKSDPRKIAEFIVAVHEGSFGLAKSFRDKKVLWSSYYSLRDYLESVSEKSEG
ncbi:TetR family transcriptional regulator [Leptospira kobayashii]|uniref:TetR family transcriptional regulator n=1 Tax=Leptospira kobayashii TaxID=1917830 RepID=A0ABN6KGG2_9LEPT|nr:TetR family transcriptional regulator [Leptospira kobayashii]